MGRSFVYVTGERIDSGGRYICVICVFQQPAGKNTGFFLEDYDDAVVMHNILA